MHRQWPKWRDFITMTAQARWVELTVQPPQHMLGVGWIFEDSTEMLTMSKSLKPGTTYVIRFRSFKAVGCPSTQTWPSNG